MKNYIYIFYSLVLFSCSPSDGNKNLPLENMEDVNFIPFEIINNSIVITTKLNNKIDVSLVVDNGCANLILLEEFINEYKDSLKLKPYKEIKAVENFPFIDVRTSYIAEGEINYYFDNYRLKNDNKIAYQYGEKQLKNYAVVVNMNTIGFSANSKVRGIIPLRIFSQEGVVFINFEKKRIEFPKYIDSTISSYKFEDINHLPIISLEYNFLDSTDVRKKHTYSTLLDLGFTGGMMMLKNKNTESKIKKLSSCFDKNISCERCNLNKIHYIEKYYLENNLFRNIFMECMSVSITGVDVVLGMLFLSKCKIGFDYSQNKIYFEPIYTETFVIKDTSSIISGVGMGIKKNDSTLRYFISVVAENLKKTDLKIRDEILKIGDVSIDNMTVEELNDIRMNKEKSYRFVVIKRGDDTLTLWRKKD